MNNQFKIIEIYIKNYIIDNQQIFIKSILAIFISFLIWFIITWIISIAEKKLKGNSFFNDNPKLFNHIRKLSVYILYLATGTYLLRLFNIIFFEKFFYAILIILISVPIKGFIKIIFEFFENKIAVKTETNIDNIIFELLNKFAGIIVYITAFILALDILGINIMPFLAGAGVAGIAIGFAAKDTLSNIIAGILLIIDRPFKIGDRIEVWSAPAESATWGDVTSIGLRATKIKTTDNIIIIIPNNQIMTRDIVNYTANSSSIRVRVNIGISYDADVSKAKDIIKKIAISSDYIERNQEPVVVVKNFGESSVDLQLRIWIKEARNRMNTISYITDKVKEAFDKKGIEIPYPKRDITIRHSDYKKI